MTGSFLQDPGPAVVHTTDCCIEAIDLSTLSMTVDSFFGIEVLEKHSSIAESFGDEDLT